jgi:hypothetical protein
MSEFEFLKAMYRRLAEAERFLSEAKRKDPKRADFVQESHVCAIQCSIKDYLELAKEATK